MIYNMTGRTGPVRKSGLSSRPGRSHQLGAGRLKRGCGGWRERAAPAAEGLVSGVERAVRLLLTAVAHLRDDLPGRRMGLVIGPQAWDLALVHFGADCPQDLDGDGFVGPADLGVLIANWGCTGLDCLGDIDGDGIVGSGDLGLVVAAWGDGC